MTSAVEVLRAQWDDSCQRLARIADGLTDDEFFWEPCAGFWSVRPDPDHPGRWAMDYPDEEPVPPPFTTIAWRLLHITHGNWIYWEFAFGPGQRDFPDLEITGSAASAVEDLVASQQPITATLAVLDDAGLDEPRPTEWGDRWPAGRVLMTLLLEQVHHGAEVSLLRDLHRHRTTLRS